MGADDGDQLRPGRYVVISVADTGTGMPPEVLEMDLVASKTFEPVRIDRLAKCLGADQRPMIKFSAPPFVPGRDLALQKTLQLSPSAR
jgi:hypothetical protein